MRNREKFVEWLFLNSEVREIYLTPSVEDLSPISGYLTFPDGVRTKDIRIQALQDIEEESNELFDVKIISAKGGARISDLHSSAVLTGESRNFLTSS